MKPNRIQQQILKNDLSDIPFISQYLDLDQFVKETNEAVNNKNTGVHYYKLSELNLMELKQYAN